MGKAIDADPRIRAAYFAYRRRSCQLLGALGVAAFGSRTWFWNSRDGVGFRTANHRHSRSQDQLVRSRLRLRRCADGGDFPQR